MGTYWSIENTKENKIKFKQIYDKHRKINENQFKDDFGHINPYPETWCDGFVKIGIYRMNHKTRKCQTKWFYTKEFRQEIKKSFSIGVA